MSLIPPTPVVMSKIKYLLKHRLEPEKSGANSDLYELMLERTKPHFEFKLRAKFRSLVDEAHQDILDVQTVIELTDSFKKNEDGDYVTDCIDSALNMHTRLKTTLKSNITKVGIISVYLQCRFDEKSQSPIRQWSDLYLDEIPSGVKKIVEDD